MEIAIWIALGYLTIGIVVASNADREQDGYIFTVVLWPLQLWAKFY